MGLLLHHVGYDSVATQMACCLEANPRICSWLVAKGLKVQYCGKDTTTLGMNAEQQLRHCITTSQTNELDVTSISGIVLFHTFFPNYNHLKWKRVKLTKNGIDSVNWEPEQYLNYLREKKGYYVAFLSTAQQDAFHAIAIDSTKKDGCVYDPEELYILKLSLEVLNVCCGPRKIFKKFAALYHLTIIPKSKN